MESDLYCERPCKHDFKLVVSLKTVDIMDTLNKDKDNVVCAGNLVVPKLFVCVNCYKFKTLND